ncbi:MAG: hypothetical protein SPJ13_02400 [Bacteroidales bacterium]|nr:hypothetical protein [Bacteroidales bacterium]
MNHLLMVALVAFVLIGLGFAGIAVKIIVKKNGEFKRHCATPDPYTGERSGCVCAGRMVTDECKGSPKYHPLEVNAELLEEAGVIKPNTKK